MNTYTMGREHMLVIWRKWLSYVWLFWENKWIYICKTKYVYGIFLYLRWMTGEDIPQTSRAVLTMPATQCCTAVKEFLTFSNSFWQHRRHATPEFQWIWGITWKHLIKYYRNWCLKCTLNNHKNWPSTSNYKISMQSLKKGSICKQNVPRVKSDSKPKPGSSTIKLMTLNLHEDEESPWPGESSSSESLVTLLLGKEKIEFF